MSKHKIGIIGGAGYTGGEMIRLLINHPFAEIAFVHSKSNSGNIISDVHADLLGETSLFFTGEISNDIDVLFLCVGHGDAKKFLEQNNVNEKIRIIDLSQDFRLLQNHAFQSRKFIYGLPELNKVQIRSARNIANPGCFASAIQLGLLPLAKAGVLNKVYTTGITGSTGAGQGLTASSQFSWRANNIQAYKALTHQHVHEVEQSLQQLQAQNGIQVNFVPWRGDFTRGIFVSSQLDSDLSINAIEELYEDFFSDHPFTYISKEPIFLKQVVNTNKCIIQLEKAGDKLVIHTVIDNLVKGASGQAIQNMNLMLGLEECAGLNLKASYF